jgi:pyruvate ferredoxin oxidoreductase gamma subunit/2-oxoisovalerate ferredoxin oxidoreductase gamma subunit
MLEIRFHGRGGQGTVVASILLAKAFFKADYEVQTFPLFGVERRGAPVEAFVRVGESKIRIRTNVYTPDHVIVQDARLVRGGNVTRGLKPDGWILINAPSQPEDLSPFAGFRLAFVDANRIAVENELGTRTHPIVNTAVIGAFARVLGAPPLSAVEEAILDEIGVKPEKNVTAARQAFEAVHLFGAVAGSAT